MHRETLASRHRPVAGRNVSQCSIKVSPNPVKVKTCYLPRKGVSAVLCSSSIVKMPSNSDETAHAAASMLTSLVSARLAVTSCFFSLSSSVAFKDYK